MGTLGTNPETSPEAAVDGDATPSERLVSAFNVLRDELVSTLWFVLGNQDDAQDAVQEAFLKCWRARDSLDSIQNLRAWIFRVAVNAGKDMRRSAWRRRAKPLRGDGAMLPDQAPPTGQALEDEEMLARLRQALLLLRNDEKEVFLLRQNGDLTYEQIAEIRQSPVGTVKTQMRSALQKLRRHLAP
jgi:RNA polymerase sigma-70 factor, ECF subfamily